MAKRTGRTVAIAVALATMVVCSVFRLTGEIYQVSPSPTSRPAPVVTAGIGSNVIETTVETSVAVDPATSGTGAHDEPSAVDTSAPKSAHRDADDVSSAVAALEEAVAGLDMSSSAQADPEAFCAAQRERLWHSLRAHAAPLLVKKLDEQRRRHEAVARGQPVPGQKYLVWSLSGGLGNRFLSLASTFMAAVLAERVFLMKDWFTPLPRGNTKQTPVIIPAPNSTEYFLEDLKRLFAPAHCPANVELLCPFLPMMSLREFRDKYPAEFDPKNHAEHAKVDIAARHDKKLQRWDRFLCAPLQGMPGRGSGSAVFFPEKFVYVWTNQYYLPALFANPHHSADMRAMFPGRKPYQDLVGLLAVPSLPVVRRVKAFFEAEAKGGGVEGLRFFPDRRRRYDALQIRAFQRHNIGPMARDFDQCWSRMKRLPGEISAGRRDPFFLASMHGVVRKHFTDKYGNATRVQAPPTEEQCTGRCEAACDQVGLADMMLLALSDRLLVSPGSTFGMFVSAFARKPPIAVREQGSCRSIPNVEPCFGSWFRRDHILRRATAQQGSPLSCRIDDVPAGIVNCEQS